MKKLLYCYLLLGFCLSGNSQDIHYSQFFNAPMVINPAQTGVFAGSKRFTANYKNQWSNVPVDYHTFSAAYDFKVADHSDTTGFWGVGISLNYDQSGDVDLDMSNGGITTSYSFRFNEDYLITPGIGISYNNRSLDPSKIITGNQWNGDAYDPSIPSEVFEQDNNAHLDFAGGLNLRRQTSYRDFIDIGLGIHNILSPDRSFNPSSFSSNITRRLSGYLFSSFKFLAKVDLLVNGLYSIQDPYQEFLLNGQLKFYLNTNNERNKALYLGFGIRNDDALIPMAAIQFKKLYLGLSYDMTFSDFNNLTSSRGGPELALRYTLYNIRPIKFKPCPIY